MVYDFGAALLSPPLGDFDGDICRARLKKGRSKDLDAPGFSTPA